MFNALFTKTDEYAKLAQALGGPGACALFGIPGSGRAMVYAALAKALDKPLCIVTPGEAEATRFAGDLNALGVAAAVFPARDYVLRPRARAASTNTAVWPCWVTSSAGGCRPSACPTRA